MDASVFIGCIDGCLFDQKMCQNLTIPGEQGQCHASDILGACIAGVTQWLNF